MATKGYAAPEVEQTYARARALCAQVGETPQLFPTLRGLCRFYLNRGALQTARELGEQLTGWRSVRPTRRTCLEAHDALGDTLFFLGDYAAARTHLEQGIALIDPTAQRAQALHHGAAPGVRCLAWRPTRCGAWAIPRRPCSGVRRPWPWPRHWPIPIVWRSPSTVRPCCITAAARCQRSRRRPRPS